jgi:flavin reductase (DIM6/NTAB) family NADH-FMN oxidoreductase RutF/rubredoxin
MDTKALFKISYGVYVITSKKDDKVNGQIANTLFQITSEPQTVAISINKQNLTYEFIESSGIFSASILSREAPLDFIGRFGFKSGREINKFEGINFKIGKVGAPVVLENAVAYLETEVINKMDAGTHTIFLGKVIEAEILNSHEPMTYAYYHEIKRGTTPKTAPTYIKEESVQEKKVQRYRCKVCGYIYDPDKGDPEAGVKAGTPFSELPNNWICPICGASKDQFEPI